MLAQSRNNLNVHHWMNGLKNRYPYNGYSAIKMNDKKILIQAALWVHLENKMSERSHMKSHVYDCICMEYLLDEQLPESGGLVGVGVGVRRE
jgi:hypothetical protein